MNHSEHSLSIKLNRRSLFVAYTAMAFLVYTLPYLKIAVPYIIAAVLMLVFLPIAMLMNSQWKNYSIILIATSTVMMAFNIVLGTYSITDAINEAVRNIRFFIPTLWAMYAMKYCSKKQQLFSLVIFMLAVGLILYKTMGALEKDQWIARILAQSKTTDTPEIRAYRLNNVGGFEFSYMIGIVTLCLTWTALKCKDKWLRIFSVLGVILCFYYIVQTMYTTLLIITTAGILLLLLFSIKSTGIRLLLILLTIVFSLGLVPFIGYLSTAFGDSLLSEKFARIYIALTGGGSSALGSRPEYILEAVSNWLKSPLFGGYAVTYSVHSFLFGLLERNGIIGIFCWGVVFRMSQKMITTQLNAMGVGTTLLNVVLLYVLVLSVLNPIGYVFEVVIAAFYVTPLWLMLINDGEKSAELISEV